MPLKRLIDEFHLTQEEVGERVGQSRSHVANTLRLLDLPADIRAMVSRGTVSAGAGRALSSIRSQTDRLRLAKEVEEGNLTVRQLEARAAGSNRATTDVHAQKADPNLVEVAEEIQAALAMRVRITGTPTPGAVTISYHSPSELARIHKLLVAADELSAAKSRRGSRLALGVSRNAQAAPTLSGAVGAALRSATATSDADSARLALARFVSAPFDSGPLSGLDPGFGLGLRTLGHLRLGRERPLGRLATEPSTAIRLDPDESFVQVGCPSGGRSVDDRVDHLEALVSVT